MQLPYKPLNVLHNHGAKVVEIVSVGHKTDKPQGGYSRDYWFYIGRLQWDDTGKVGDVGNIDPGWLCSDTQEGRQEINDLSKLMMDYLHQNGEWFEDGKHQGWYAHRKSLGPVYDSTGRLMASVGPL
jgi:hypothetical protein